MYWGNAMSPLPVSVSGIRGPEMAASSHAVDRLAGTLHPGGSTS